MTHNVKLMPNLDEKSTKVLNLTVLQRIDPFVEEILITAAHVTFYEFNVETSQWRRKDVEGSLFVVKRNTQPRFQFIVMNRRNTDNLVENLLGDFEYEVQIPYLLYRNAAQEVNGIWFYNAHECEEVANFFSRYREALSGDNYLHIYREVERILGDLSDDYTGILNAYSKVPTKSKVASAKKSEFEELEAFPSMAVMDGPLEPSPSTNSNVADVADDPSFVNFFSMAMNLGNAPNAPIPRQSYQLSAPIARSSHPPTLTAAHTPSPLSTSTPTMPIFDTPEPISYSKHSTDLVKPSSFFIPPPSSSPLVIPSSMPTAPPLDPPRNLKPYGTPLLQPFPPPTPPPSLTPTAPVSNYRPVITRDEVCKALAILIQDNKFIDMVYQAIQNARSS